MPYPRLSPEFVALVGQSRAFQLASIFVQTDGERMPREDCRQQFVLRMVGTFTVGNNCLDLESKSQTPCDSAEVISPVAGLCWRTLVSFDPAG